MPVCRYCGEKIDGPTRFCSDFCQDEHRMVTAEMEAEADLDVDLDGYSDEREDEK